MNQEDEDAFCMAVAHDVARLSYCKRKQVGAVITRDGNILAYGFNGTLFGDENVCEDEHGNTKDTVVHAERNALSKITRSTETSEGATMYVTLAPCTICASLIIMAKIKRVVYAEMYPASTDGVRDLETHNIEVIHYENNNNE